MIWDKLESLFMYALGLAVAAGMWVLRNVLTNGKRLDLLEQAGKHQSELRAEDHEAIKEVRKDVRDLKTYLMEHNR